MSFSTLMSGLFKTKETFPNMRWDVEKRTYGESTVTITIPIDEDEAQLLLDAQRMFAPR